MKGSSSSSAPGPSVSVKLSEDQTRSQSQPIVTPKSAIGEVQEPAAGRFTDLPLGMQLLERNPQGYPVPWFVDRRAPFRDGGPDFRVMDGKRLRTAIRERRCWVCGLRLRGEQGTFVAGPMCGVNRTSAEPPCHLDCALASARACPFLSHPGRVRDDRGKPHGVVAGVGITRNPGVTMLWTSDYETWTPPGGGVLFEMGEPTAVRWLRRGRQATRAEVVESVTTGLPLLMEQCATTDDLAALDAYVERFAKYLPQEAAPLSSEVPPLGSSERSEAEDHHPGIRSEATDPTLNTQEGE